VKSHHPSVFETFIESVEGLFDILRIGASALEEQTPDADARNLHADLEQISGDFRRVMSGISSGKFGD
jgi:hypothetical protein